MLNALIEVLLPIVVVVAVGFGLRRQFPLDLQTLNRVAVYGLSPALIFVSLVRADIAGGEALRMMVLSVAVTGAMALVTAGLAWPLRVRGADLSALLLASMFMNSGNYGLPASRFAFGEGGFERAILFFIPQSIMMQTVGVGVAAASAPHTSARPRAWEVARRVLLMPQVTAVLAALLVRGLNLELEGMPGIPGALFAGVALLSEAMLPLMLVLLGMQLAQGVTIEQPGRVALASGLRLLVSPVLAYGLAQALGLSAVGTAVGVFQAAMPAAVNTTILALEFDARPGFVVGTVVVTTVASLLTLSFVLSLLGMA